MSLAPRDEEAVFSDKFGKNTLLFQTEQKYRTEILQSNNRNTSTEFTKNGSGFQRNTELHVSFSWLSVQAEAHNPFGGNSKQPSEGGIWQPGG